MFSSVEREDVEPTCPYYQGTGDRTCKSGCWQEPVCITGEPLNGYLPPQHNAPNPILLWHRGTTREGMSPIAAQYVLDHWAATIGALPELGITTYTPDHEAHARLVLSRLARLAKEN
jgi:hypothetical protein